MCIRDRIGSFPALNARPAELLDQWLSRITSELAADPQAAAAAFLIARGAVARQTYHLYEWSF